MLGLKERTEWMGQKQRLMNQRGSWTDLERFIFLWLRKSHRRFLRRPRRIHLWCQLLARRHLGWRELNNLGFLRASDGDVEHGVRRFVLADRRRTPHPVDQLLHALWVLGEQDEAQSVSCNAGS